MKQRNMSPQEMFRLLAQEHAPECSFGTPGVPADFSQWKEATFPRVMGCLGRFPDRVDPNAELLAEWEHDGLVKQRWMVDLIPHLSATVLVNRPPDMKVGEKRAALLCWHGHGPYGKEAVMGSAGTPGLRDNIALHNYDYGHQMAKAGFVTFAVDWMRAGDLLDDGKPNWRNQSHGRDWCNLYYLHATMLGMTSVSVNVAIGRAATDFAVGLPFVDADRLGVMGLSGGGTMTLWSSLCDDRFKASEIICYSAYWPNFGFRDINYCGMQVAPGLFALVHLHDLHGMIAPRPLLVDIGAYDDCFPIDESMTCYKATKRIYEAAGYIDRLELDLFSGPHAWGGNKSVEFFGKHLG